MILAAKVVFLGGCFSLWVYAILAELGVVRPLSYWGGYRAGKQLSLLFEHELENYALLREDTSTLQERISGYLYSTWGNYEITLGWQGSQIISWKFRSSDPHFSARVRGIIDGLQLVPYNELVKKHHIPQEWAEEGRKAYTSLLQVLYTIEKRLISGDVTKTSHYY